MRNRRNAGCPVSSGADNRTSTQSWPCYRREWIKKKRQRPPKAAGASR